VFFNSQKAEKIAPKIEAKLRKELGATAPLSHRMVGGEGGALFYMEFALPSPPPSRLLACVLKNGLLGAMVGELFYSAQLSKTIRSRAWLAREAQASGAAIGFAGDAEACEKLTADRRLVGRAAAFTRDREIISTTVIEIKSGFEIAPQPGAGSLLAVRTLMKGGWFSGSFDAREFLDIAAAIETTLPVVTIECKCPCHGDEYISHFVACCHRCPHCNRDIAYWTYENHLKHCAAERRGATM